MTLQCCLAQLLNALHGSPYHSSILLRPLRDNSQARELNPHPVLLRRHTIWLRANPRFLQPDPRFRGVQGQIDDNPLVRVLRVHALFVLALG